MNLTKLSDEEIIKLIKDDKVTIDLDIWSSPIEYKYEIKNGKLNLTATNGYSANYEGLTKKK